MYHFGYYAFYFSYDQHLESKWEEIIYSENSIEAKEMLIEIPLSAPYMANQEEFQPTNTPYEKDGQHFRAIKQRYQNDTLQIIVVPDRDRGVLDNNFKKWISFITDDEVPQDSSGNTLIMLFVKDYIQSSPLLFQANISARLNSSVQYLCYHYLDPAKRIFSPPPQHA